MNNKIDTVLGQKVDSPDLYSPTILVRGERSEGRRKVGIDPKQLPFQHGVDIWNGYEVSALLTNGKPFTAIARVVYDCKSKYIVESKSMKLYWNSFNNEQVAMTKRDALRQLKRIATEDLSKLLETNVRVDLYECEFTDYPCDVFTDYFNEYSNLDNLPFDSHTSLNVRLKTSKDKDRYEYTSTLLRSRCPITGAPDFGDIFIDYVPNRYVAVSSSILGLIVGHRNTQGFHEVTCESIYNELFQVLEPKSLTVQCMYTRRGGWDINPIRSNDLSIFKDYITGNREKLVRQ